MAWILKIGTQRLMLEGKPLHQLECNWKVYQGWAPVLKQALSGDNEFSPSVVIPLWNKPRNITVKIFLWVFLSLTILGLKQKEWRMTTQVCPTHHHATLNHIHLNLILPCKIQVSGMGFSEKSYAMLLIHLGYLYL